MTHTPSWRQADDEPEHASSRPLIRVLAVLGVGGAVGVVWRELFEAVVYLANRISSLG